MNDQKSDLLGQAREILEFARMEANPDMVKAKVELAHAYMTLCEWFNEDE